MKENISSLILASPIGNIRINGNSTSITAISFDEESCHIRASRKTPQPVLEAAKQLNEYFTGLRKNFFLPLAPAGTPFQKQVWEQLLRIPYGQTLSYADIAGAISNPGAVRAVGGANNKNPVGIVIPCHRVIGKNGKLTGYGGGLWRKEWLLHHERKQW